MGWMGWWPGGGGIRGRVVVRGGGFIYIIFWKLNYFNLHFS